MALIRFEIENDFLVILDEKKTIIKLEDINYVTIEKKYNFKLLKPFYLISITLLALTNFSIKKDPLVALFLFNIIIYSIILVKSKKEKLVIKYKKEILKIPTELIFPIQQEHIFNLILRQKNVEINS